VQSVCTGPVSTIFSFHHAWHLRSCQEAMVRLPSGAFRRRVVPQGVGTAAFGSCSPDVKDISGAGLMLCRDGPSSPSCCVSPQRRAPAVARRRSTSRGTAEERRQLNEAYVVEEAVLGSGGFGTVRRAWPKTGGSACVVKTLPKCSRRGSGHDHLAESARHEAEVLRRLDHERICKILDVYEDDKHVYLVLEFIEGRELFDEIAEKGPMPEKTAAGIMRQIFEALEHCHEPGHSVLHRDLKPENVMVGHDNTDVKIIDFGLAVRCPEDGTLQTPIVGTAEYLAPEALSEGLYSRASDLWGAGAVLHMMLTGGALPLQVGANRCNTELLQELKISSAAQELLKGLLRVRPEERLTALEARMHPWTQGADSGDDVAVAVDAADCERIFVDAAVAPVMPHVRGDDLVYVDVEAADASDVGYSGADAGSVGETCTDMVWPGFHCSSGAENFQVYDMNALQDDLCKTSCCEIEKLPVVLGSNFKENVLPGLGKAHGRRRRRQLLPPAVDEHNAHTRLPVCYTFNEPANPRRPVLLR